MFRFKKPSDEFERLRGWISRHRPDIEERISGRDLMYCLEILNKETGLEIQPYSAIQTTAPIFLRALQGIESKKDEAEWERNKDQNASTTLAKPS